MIVTATSRDRRRRRRVRQLLRHGPLTNGREDELTDCSISQKIDGKTYCFGNNSAKEAFMKDPQAEYRQGASESSRK